MRTRNGEFLSGLVGWFIFIFLILQGLAYLPPSVAATRPEELVHDSNDYYDATGLEDFSPTFPGVQIADMAVIYESRFGDRETLRRQGASRSKVRELAKGHRDYSHVVIDIEAWEILGRYVRGTNSDKWNEPHEWEVTVERWSEVINWWKEANTETRICAYGIPSRRSARDAVRLDKRGQFIEAERAAARITALADFLCPSGYWNPGDQRFNAETWGLIAQVGADTHRRPVHFFVWHRISHRDGWLAPNNYRFSLDVLSELGDSIVFWAAWDERAKYRFRLPRDPKKSTVIGPASGASTNKMLRDFNEARLDAAHCSPVSECLERESLWIDELDQFFSRQ